MKILLGSDHAGFNLKEAVKEHLVGMGHEVQDVGVHSTDSADYPEQAAQVAGGVAAGDAERGILVCGSGVGMCMTANRVKGVRGVMAPTVEYARMGRLHNNANVLCLGERFTPADEAMGIVDVFLAEQFEGGRHQRRIQKIDTLTGG